MNLVKLVILVNLVNTDHSEICGNRDPNEGSKTRAWGETNEKSKTYETVEKII